MLQVAILERKEKIGINTINLFFVRADNKKWSYTPGQSTLLFINPSYKVINPGDNLEDICIEENRRKYSMCNKSVNEKTIEFAVAVVGKISRWLEACPIGTRVVIGNFGSDFEYKPKDKVVFVGTGTGMSPLRCMLYNRVIEDKTLQSLEIIQGSKSRETLIWKNELKNLTNKDKRIKYTICLSREKEILEEHEFLGRVTKYIQNIDATGKDFYLCGNGNMIEDVSNMIGNQCDNCYFKRYFKN